MSQNNTNEPGKAPELNTDEPVRVNHTARNIIIAVLVVLLVAAGAFFGFHQANKGNGGAAASAETKGTKDNPVKIGVVGATDPQWVEFKKQAEAKDLYVDIVDANGDVLVPASGQDISDLIAAHGIHSGLLYGGIDTVQDIAIGAVTYEFTGDPAKIDAFLDDLARGSDIVDFGTKDAPIDYDTAVARAHIADAPAPHGAQGTPTLADDLEMVEDVDDVVEMNPDTARKERD